jgi:type IV pilus assembly protein PilQ
MKRSVAMVLSMFAMVVLMGAGIVFAQEAVQAPAEGTETAAAPEVSTAELQQVEEKSGNVTFDFKDADIRNVLRIFSHKTGINIVAGKEVVGTVTITLRDVPWEQALKLVLNINGFGYVREANVIKVLTMEQLSQEPLETKIYTLNYAKPKDVSDILTKMKSERGQIQLDERAGLIIAYDVPSKFKEMDIVVERLDTPTPQVLIEGKVIETTYNDNTYLGIKWDSVLAPTIDLTGAGTNGAIELDKYTKTRTQTDTSEWGTDSSGDRAYNYYPHRVGTLSDKYKMTGVDPDNLPMKDVPFVMADTLTNNAGAIVDTSAINASSATLSARALQMTLNYLVNDTNTDILSSPHIVTTNNTTAEIMVGTQYPIANYVFSSETGRLEVQGFNYKDIGIKLSVTPKVSPDGYITMDIKPEISEKGTDVEFGGSVGQTVPEITIETLKTTVLVKDGDSLILGGLLKQKENGTHSKVPFFGDIPLIGYLFKNKSINVTRRNLLVFMTPTVIKMENAKDVTARKQEEYRNIRAGYPYKELVDPTVAPAAAESK